MNKKIKEFLKLDLRKIILTALLLTVSILLFEQIRVLLFLPYLIISAFFEGGFILGVEILLKSILIAFLALLSFYIISCTILHFLNVKLKLIVIFAALFYIILFSIIAIKQFGNEIYYTYFKEDCKDNVECFISNLKLCKPTKAVFSNIGSCKNTELHTIEGYVNGECITNLNIISSDCSKFEEPYNSLECNVNTNVFNNFSSVIELDELYFTCNPSGQLKYCEGELGNLLCYRS